MPSDTKKFMKVSDFDTRSNISQRFLWTDSGIETGYLHWRDRLIVSVLELRTRAAEQRSLSFLSWLGKWLPWFWSFMFFLWFAFPRCWRGNICSSDYFPNRRRIGRRSTSTLLLYRESSLECGLGAGRRSRGLGLPSAEHGSHFLKHSDPIFHEVSVQTGILIRTTFFESSSRALWITP